MNCATYCVQRLFPDLFPLRVMRFPSFVFYKLIHFLIDSAIQKHGQHDWCRSIDCHRNGCVGGGEIKTAVQCFDIVQGADADTAFTYFAVDVRAGMRIVTIECDRIKSGGEAFGRVVFAEIMEPLVCPDRGALTGELSLRLFTTPLEGKSSCCEGKTTGQIFQKQELEGLAIIFPVRNCDAGNAGTG